MAIAALVGGAFAQPVVVMQSADANTLDPTMIRETPSFNVLLNIFDGLLFKQADGTFTGGLAQEWRAVDDTTWEFNLRQDVTFHNGEAFGANAVKFTIERILDPQVQSPISSGFEFISGVQVVDDHTLIITTSDPQPLAETYFSEILPVPPAYFQEVGAAAFAQAPVGTGPFRFVSWRRDVAVTLEGNPDYWGGAPALAQVEFRPTPEATTRFASLAAGEADLITSVPPSLVSSVQASPNAKLETVDSARVIYVGINTLHANPALADARVRQALNFAVDVVGINEGIFGGLATPRAAERRGGTE
jgi:peptide/nickel transport system substrate-binding protein